MKSQNRRIVVVVLAAFALVLLSGTSAIAQDGVVTDDPSLPPKDGVYLTAADVHANYTGPGLDLMLQQPAHKPIADRAEDVVREAIRPRRAGNFQF